MMKSLLNRAIHFFEPSPKINDPLERQQATILTNLLIFFLITSVIFFLVFEYVNIFTNHQNSRPLFAIIGVLQYFPLIWFSRTKYYKIVGIIFIVWTSILINYAAMTYDSPYAIAVLYYSNTLLVVSGLVLNSSVTIFFMVIYIAIAWIFPYINPEQAISPIHISVLHIAIALGIIILSETTKRFKRQLMQSETLYRDMMEANSEGILVLSNQTGRIVDANQAIENIMGYTREEFIGQNALEFLQGESKRIAGLQWRNRDSVPKELIASRKDGTQIIVMATIRSHFYQGENCFIVRVLDVTEQKRIEKALREAEQRARIIFNESDQLIGVLNTEGTILEANERTYQFYGLKPTDLIGRKIWEINHWSPNERANAFIQKVMQTALTGESLHYEASVRDAKGEVAYLAMVVKPIFDAQHQVSLIITEGYDITARRIAEEQGFEFQRRYESLFTSTTDAVLITGLDNILIGANQRALQVFKCDHLDDIIGEPATAFVVEDDLTQMQAMREKLNDPSFVPNIYERKMRRKNGEVFVAEVSVMMVRDQENNPLYIQSMVRDTTDRRKQERQQFELALQREKTKLLQHFIDEASHHFRTPITNIKTSIYLLQKTKNNPEKQERQYQALDVELQRLDNLLNDLLTVTRLQKDDSQFRIGNIAINQLLIEVRSRFEGREDYAEHQWDWYLNADEIIVIGDKHHMARALMNLIDNATRYTPPDGRILVRTTIRDQWLVIEIADNGIGIAEADMPHIFEDFYRGAEAQAKDSTSSGLGLSITKQIIERHRGYLRFRSILGEGTSAKIILPINIPWQDPLPALPEDLVAQIPTPKHSSSF